MLGVEHAVLQQVPDPAAPVLHELAGVEGLDVLREHQHRQARTLPPRINRHAQSLVGERRWQAHVDDGDVEVLGQQRPTQLGSGLRRRHDLASQGLQHAAQAIAQQELILGNQHAHGSTSLASPLVSRFPTGLCLTGLCLPSAESASSSPSPVRHCTLARKRWSFHHCVPAIVSAGWEAQKM